MINPGEVSHININVVGSGYSVGDSIPTSALDVALPGATTDAIITVGAIDNNGGILWLEIANRGEGYDPGAALITISGAGNNDAQITISTLNEGVVLAQGCPIINIQGFVTESYGLAWSLDRLLPGGLTDATSAAAAFLQAEPGNALSLPAP